MSDLPIPPGPASVTAEWVDRVLRNHGVLDQGRVERIQVEPFAHGVGLLGKLARIHVEASGASEDLPRTLVAKFPSESAQNLALCKAIRLYWREHQFYTRSAGETPLRVPTLFHAAMDGLERFVLVLEDVAWGEPGNQIEGATPEQTRTAAIEVAGHHARFAGRAHAGTRSWLPRLDEPAIVGVVQALTAAGAQRLTEHLPEAFTEETRQVTLTLAEHLPALTASICAGPTTFAHGDFRVDNLLFGRTPTDPTLTVVDWQICYEACIPYDMSYFMTQSVEPGVRRSLQDDVLATYHQSLVEGGLDGYDLGHCREDFRKAATYCLCYPLIAAGTLDLENDRGRALGKMMLGRSLSAVEDVDSAAVLASLA